jgi:hypothetical protein
MFQHWPLLRMTGREERGGETLPALPAGKERSAMRWGHPNIVTKSDGGPILPLEKEEHGLGTFDIRSFIETLRIQFLHIYWIRRIGRKF